MCLSCSTMVDHKVMTGAVWKHNGRPKALCQWCCMCIDDYIRTVMS